MADNITLNTMTGGSVVATDDLSSVHHQYVKVEYGADGSATPVDSTNPLPVREEVVNGVFRSYSDTSFVAGDSPATLDVNTDLGRDARYMAVFNDGAGAIDVDVSYDGATFSTTHRVAASEKFELNNIRIDTIRLTHVADSSYRVIAF